ncbi:MAG: hypothetical protein HOQ03_04630 [Thermoleophilia bacterium]|nr:hypothetical protein [Thermoleophilia bacterium]
MSTSFVVEEAGCESCAALVRESLEPLGTVESVEIDEAADVSRVVLSGAVTEAEVGAALAEASEGVGHAYRVRPGSWSD